MALIRGRPGDRGTETRGPHRLALTLGLAGLVLVLSLVLSVVGARYSRTSSSRQTAESQGRGDALVPRDWEPELPVDLRAERLPLPKWTPPEVETERPPAGGGDPDPISEDRRSRLSALRVDDVDYRAPVAVELALGAPTAPARIVPGEISPSGFGGTRDAANRRGWGGGVIDGAGTGLSGLGSGGGECSRGSGGYPGIIERSRQILPY